MPFSFRQVTRGALRRKIGFLVFGRDKFLHGTATAGTSTTFTLTEAQRFTTGALVGRVAHIVSGTGSGQSRLVSANTQGTGTCTVSPAWVTAPDVDSEIEIWDDRITPDEVNAKIDLAVLEASDLTPIYAESASPTLNADRDIVTLPATFTHLIDFSYIGSADRISVRYYPRQYINLQTDEPHFVMYPGRKINLSHAIPDDILGADMTVRGYRLPAEMDSDDDLCEIRPDYLIYKAATSIEASAIGSSVNDIENHDTRGAAWLRGALALEPRMAPVWEPYTQRVLA